ncbi:putative Zinc finger, TRAF-type, Zinc finger, RING/FYVE/PHD-type, ankyrin repeat-containing [Plasmopara halstedii]
MSSIGLLHSEKHGRKSKKYIFQSYEKEISDRIVNIPLRKKAKKRDGLEKGSRSMYSKLTSQYEEALRRQDLQQVLWMITNGDISPDYETKDGDTALLAAIATRDRDTFAILMTSGISINSSNRKGYTPLMKAIALAVLRHPSKFQLKNQSLISNNKFEKKQSLNCKQFDNEMIAMVLAFKPNLHQMDQSGKTAFDWARLTGNTQVLEWLSQCQIEQPLTDQSKERMTQCQKILTYHNEYLQRMEELIAPQFFNEKDLIEFLKSMTITLSEFEKARSDFKILDKSQLPMHNFLHIETQQGWTPLTRCAALNYNDGVQELLKLGVELHYETKLRHTAMTWASYCGHEAVVLTLLQAGVDVNQRTREGKTALMHAISNSQAQIVHHLLLAIRDECFPKRLFQTSIEMKTIKHEEDNNETINGLQSIELEWYTLFLEKMQWQDSMGKDFLMLAKDAVEQAQKDNYDILDNKKKIDAATQVLKQVKQAIEEAQAYQVYSAKLVDRTEVTTCSNENCQFIATKDMMLAHEQYYCSNGMVKCRYCDLNVLMDDKSRHEVESCSMRRVSCINLQYGCQENVVYQDREHHVKYYCQKRLVKCRLDCGFLGHFDTLHKHESLSCPLRIVTCAQGCGATFPSNQSKHHERDECSQRIIACIGEKQYIGCGELIKVDEMKAHLTTLCQYRKIACKWALYGCNKEIGGIVQAREYHETIECPYRLVSCRHNCELSGQFVACFADEHYRWQCQLEPIICSNNCRNEVTNEVLQVPRYLQRLHFNCSLRQFHCPLDLCGKSIRIYNTERNNVNHDEKNYWSNNMTISRQVMQHRIAAYDAFFTTFQTSQSHTNERMFSSLQIWLQSLYHKLNEDSKHHQLQMEKRAQMCRVLAFDFTTFTYQVEYSDNSLGSLFLQYCDYDLVSNQDETSVLCCGLLTMESLNMHIQTSCCHRLIPCPLNCGEQISIKDTDVHVSQECTNHNVKCGLGCGEIMAFALLSTHENDSCDLRLRNCEYCQSLVSCLKTHFDKACQHRPRGCRLGCSDQVTWAEQEKHEMNRCSKYLISCLLCKKFIWRSELKVHDEMECSFRYDGSCDNNCGEILRQNERKSHLLNVCINRLVECSQCSEQIKFSSLSYHQNSLCSQRKVYCQQGCGDQFKANEMENHEKEFCSKRFQKCFNKCGMKLSMDEMNKHLHSSCALRLLSCPTGCREVIVAYLQHDHWKHCRHRLVPCGVGGKLCLRPLGLWHRKNQLVQCAIHSETAFFWAIHSQDLDLTSYFLHNIDARTVVNEEFTIGSSPLGLAASIGNIELIYLLLRFGANVNFETSRGRTPLAEACVAQNIEVVKVLIENRASVTYTNRYGRNLKQLIHDFAQLDSIVVDSKAQELKWKEILHLLDKQEELEQAQRNLFLAIGCSNYKYLINLLTSSSKTSNHELLLASSMENLVEIVNMKEKMVVSTCSEYNEAITDSNNFNNTLESIRSRVIEDTNQVNDYCRQLQEVKIAEEQSECFSNTLETNMLAMLRQISAQEIAMIVNSKISSEISFIILKTVLILCGFGHNINYTSSQWWELAQALVMDRKLLRQLRQYRQQIISSNAKTQIQVECFSKLPSYTRMKEKIQTFGFDFDTRQKIEIQDVENKSIAILAMWIIGVEMEWQAKEKRQLLFEEKEKLENALLVVRAKQENSTLEAQNATQSLQDHQDDLEKARIRKENAINELHVAKKQVFLYKVFTFVALNGHTPFTFACAVGNEAIVHLLISYGVSSGFQLPERILCASFIQAFVRNIQFRKKSSRQHLNERFYQRKTHQSVIDTWKHKILCYRQSHRVAIHEAIINGHSKIIAILLSNGAKVWQKSYVLPQRSYPGSYLESIAPLSKRTYKLRSPWILQPLGSKFNVLKAQENEIDLNNSMTVIQTLQCALQYYDSQLFLGSKGWDAHETVYSSTKAIVTKELCHVEKCRVERQKELESHKLKLLKVEELQKKLIALDIAIMDRNFPIIAQLLDDGAYADYETKDGAITALMAACMEECYVRNADRNDVLAVEFLLNRTTNCPRINFENSRGCTALEIAVSYGTLKCAQVLLSRGGDINYVTQLNGRTALMVAAESGNEACVHFLVANEHVDPFLQDLHGKRALDYARTKGFVKIMGLLEAAMGNRQTRVVSTISGLYGVCKWGCGYMTPFEGHVVQESQVIRTTKPLEDHEQHHCRKRLVTCPNDCHLTNLWAEELEKHLYDSCERRIVTCTNQKCTVRYLFQDQWNHLNNECQFRVVLCDCGQNMTFKRHVVHTKTECSMRRVFCPLQCEESYEKERFEYFQLRWKDVKVHIAQECPHRNIRCRNGCTIQKLRAKDRTVHESTECLLRRVSCTWGCGETIFAKTQKLHEQEECVRRRQNCPYRCGCILSILEMKEHILTNCSRRLVECPLHCDRRISLHILENHVANECCKRSVTCVQCQQVVIEENRTTHQKTACPYRATSCILCGQTNLVYAQMGQHRSEECKMRSVTCKYQCYGKVLVAHEKEWHELWECALRPIYCPLGCSKTFPCNTLKKHQQVCTMRFVVCGNGCGEELREKDRIDHERHYCSMNKVYGSMLR